MSEVKRFDTFTSFDDFKSRMVESKDGNYVAYSDYLSQRQQTDALQTSLNNIIYAFGIKGEGAHSKLVIKYVHGLVAENAALKDTVERVSGVYKLSPHIQKLCEIKTPNTDAFTAELRAQGVDEFSSSIGAESAGLSMSSNAYKAIKSTVFRAVNFAANLRAGRKG